MNRLGVFFSRSAQKPGNVIVQVTNQLIVALLLLQGCGPAMNTQSLRLEEPLLTPAVTQEGKTTESLPNGAQPPVRFDPLTTTPPFVYRVVEALPSEPPLFAVTLQSCGKPARHSSLGSTRLLFSGLEQVQVTTGRELAIGSERFPLQAANGRLEGIPVFLRVLQLPTAECLTDIVVWASSDDRLTERAAPAIEQLLIMHRHHVTLPSHDDQTPPF